MPHRSVSSWETNSLNKDDREVDSRRRKSRALLAVVGLGIAFFVTGFVLAVTSLSEPDTVLASEDALQTSGSGVGSASFTLFLGLLLSLAGVVLATAGPAMFFIHAGKRSG
ncbi:MAG TPA: hypothetical protein HA364_05505 [Thermoplasmata archaeon]|nr:hypothetical protein [Thermoplasmata archaeon]